MTADTNQGDGYTRTPHWTYDLMPVVTPAQFKVIAAAVRLTYGWHQEWTDASAQTVAELTGINRSTVAEILNFFVALELIERTAGERNSYRWRLVPTTPVDLSAKATAHLSAKATGDDLTCRLRRQLPVASGDSHLSAKATTYKEERKSLKKGKERERTAPAAPAPKATAQSNQGTATVETATPQQSARTPNPPVSAAPPSPLPTGTPTCASARPAPVEVEQPRLVDAEIADALTVYRQVAGVKTPNQAQRAAIREHVTSDLDLWREACDYFARNSFNVRKIDNVIDRYQKAVKGRRAEEAAQREAEERRRQAAPVHLTPEEQERRRRLIEEGMAKLNARIAQRAAEADPFSYLRVGRHRQARAS